MYVRKIMQNKFHILQLCYLSVFFISILKADDNLKILKQLKDNKDWILIEDRSDSIRVYEKQIDRMDLKALKVEKVVKFNPKSILETVMDINNYSNILSSDDLTSFIIGQKNNLVYAYNHIPIPLPFIEDRHYIFTIKKVSNKEVSWSLVDYAKVKATSKLKAMINKNPTAVYLDYGAGFWYVEPLTESISQVSYTLYMDSGGALTNNLNDLFTSQSIINLYKNVLKEGKKRVEK